jgi:hypothetical protein
MLTITFVLEGATDPRQARGSRPLPCPFPADGHLRCLRSNEPSAPSGQQGRDVSFVRSRRAATDRFGLVVRSRDGAAPTRPGPGARSGITHASWVPQVTPGLALPSYGKSSTAIELMLKVGPVRGGQSFSTVESCRGGPSLGRLDEERSATLAYVARIPSVAANSRES